MSRLPPRWPETVCDGASGAGAALVKTLVLHPLDTLKTRLQLGQPYTELRNLYNGIGAAVVRSSGGMASSSSSRYMRAIAISSAPPSSEVSVTILGLSKLAIFLVRVELPARGTRAGAWGGCLIRALSFVLDRDDVIF